MNFAKSFLIFLVVLILFVSRVYGINENQTLPANGDDKQLETSVRRLLDTVKNGKSSEVIELDKKMILPDAEGWFRKVFGDDAGSKLAADYKHWADEMKSENAVKELKLVVDSGRLEIVVRKVVETNDPNHYYNEILSKMKMVTKPDIYEVRLIKPHSPGEFFELGFFTDLDGDFRNIGDLRAVR
jgi:hypothetical protein